MFTALTVKAGELIFIGFSLSLGFWAGKKLTNKIDYYLFTKSDEFKKLAEKQQQVEGVV
jgi:hypothetical protein